MSAKVFNNWSGLISIIWMVALSEVIEHLPDNFLPDLDLSSWPVLITFLVIWLGVGLFFAISGLRCRSSLGQLAAVAGIFVFAYFAWFLLFPRYEPSLRTNWPNHQMHRTTTSRCGFGCVGLIGRWIGSQSPFPVAVGDLGRWTEVGELSSDSARHASGLDVRETGEGTAHDDCDRCSSGNVMRIGEGESPSSSRRLGARSSQPARFLEDDCVIAEGRFGRDTAERD